MVFHKRPTRTFASMLIKAEDAVYGTAAQFLEAHKRPEPRSGAMREAFVSDAELRAIWPNCPLLP